MLVGLESGLPCHDKDCGCRRVSYIDRPRARRATQSSTPQGVRAPVRASPAPTTISLSQFRARCKGKKGNTRTQGRMGERHSHRPPHRDFEERSVPGRRLPCLPTCLPLSALWAPASPLSALVTFMPPRGRSNLVVLLKERKQTAQTIGADPDFAKYFAKYALPARREKFPEISPVRLM